MVTREEVCAELGSLMYWTMLAASTVGPGTVIVACKAGFEYGNQLLWCLIFASFMAYVLLEATARLTIIGKASLGQALRIKYKDSPQFYESAAVCWFCSIAVCIGNTLYQCNNFAGGADALLAFPGANESVNLVRIVGAAVYAIIVIIVLWLDKTDSLGKALGGVTVGMVVLFVIVDIMIGVDGMQVLRGILPSMPDGSSDLVLSLVGTTAIGFNLFLGGAMAEGKEIGAVRRGLKCSVFAAFVVSMLILLVGAGIRDQVYEEGDEFSMEMLTTAVNKLLGDGGQAVLSIAFVAAAISSMFTVVLGITLTVQSSLYDKPKDVAVGDVCRYRGSCINLHEIARAEAAESEEALHPTKFLSLKKKHSIEWTCALVPFVLIGVANADRVSVVMVAQVFNGCLLPMFSCCLYLCINDEKIMKEAPQSRAANAFLLPFITVASMLAFNGLLSKVWHDDLPRLLVALGLAIALSLWLCWMVYKTDSSGESESTELPLADLAKPAEEELLVDVAV